MAIKTPAYVNKPVEVHGVRSLGSGVMSTAGYLLAVASMVAAWPVMELGKPVAKRPARPFMNDASPSGETHRAKGNRGQAPTLGAAANEANAGVSKKQFAPMEVDGVKPTP